MMMDAKVSMFLMAITLFAFSVSLQTQIKFPLNYGWASKMLRIVLKPKYFNFRRPAMSKLTQLPVELIGRVRLWNAEAGAMEEVQVFEASG